LAVGLADRYPDSVDLDTVETNMVVVDGRSFPFSLPDLVDRLREKGINIGTLGPHMVRLVTHRDVDAGDVDRLLAVVDAMTQ
jgi:threonine aldolase